MSDWFLKEGDMGEAPKKKSTGTRFSSPLPTTCMTRILDEVEIFEDNYPKNNLYCSNIGDPDWDLGTEILAFWRPSQRKKDLFGQMYMEQSSLKHQLIQNHWHETGLMHPLHTKENEEGEKEFKEVKAYIPEYGLKGKIDLILPNPSFLKELGAKTAPEKRPEQKGWTVGDIKECSSHVYKTIHEHIPPKYRTQVSLYHYWAVDQGIMDQEDECFFYYLNRDNPRTYKWVPYKSEEDLVTKAFHRANKFWEHIRNRTHPEIKDFEKHCEESIELQPDRRWNPLSGIESKEEN